MTLTIGCFVQVFAIKLFLATDSGLAAASMGRDRVADCI